MKPKLILCLALVLSGGLFNFVNVGWCGDETATNVLAKPKIAKSLNDLSMTISKDYSNFIPNATMVTTNLMGTNYASDVPKMLTSVETNVLTTLTNTAMVEMGLAAKYLLELKKQGFLPGTPKDQHGNVTTDDVPLSKLKEAKYPFSLIFNVVLIGDSLTNHYTVTRASENADWQLQKAWRTDTEGHTVNEWPVK